MPTNDREYMREYMRKARKLGKIKHWRQYLKEKQNEKKEKQTCNYSKSYSEKIHQQGN